MFIFYGSINLIFWKELFANCMEFIKYFENCYEMKGSKATFRKKTGRKKKENRKKTGRKKYSNSTKKQMGSRRNINNT